MVGFWTLGLGTTGFWTIGLWTTGRMDFGRLDLEILSIFSDIYFFLLVLCRILKHFALRLICYSSAERAANGYYNSNQLPLTL